MRMKGLLRKIGRIFITLNQVDKDVLAQKILVVDNGYSPFFQLQSAIEKLKVNLPESEVNILTLKHRKDDIINKFSDINVILADMSWCKRYQIALQMLKLFRIKFDFIILLSLDITPIIVSLIFMKKRNVVLYNQYFQWWRLGLRKLGQPLEYFPRKRYRFKLKNLVSRIGNRFIHLSQVGEKILHQRNLIIDNGYADFEQIDRCLSNVNKVLPKSEIHVLTFPHRREHFIRNFPFINLCSIRRSLIKRYQLAINMWPMRKQRFDYIILSSLDISPLIISLVFMKKYKILLYNQWHQWWVIRLRTSKEIILFIPNLFLKVSLHSVIFIYLLLVTSLIFLRRTFNILRLKKTKGI